MSFHRAIVFMFVNANIYIILRNRGIIQDFCMIPRLNLINSPLRHIHCSSSFLGVLSLAITIEANGMIPASIIHLKNVLAFMFFLFFKVGTINYSNRVLINSSL